MPVVWLSCGDHMFSGLRKTRLIKLIFKNLLNIHNKSNQSSNKNFDRYIKNIHEKWRWLLAKPLLKLCKFIQPDMLATHANLNNWKREHLSCFYTFLCESPYIYRFNDILSSSAGLIYWPILVISWYINIGTYNRQ